MLPFHILAASATFAMALVPAPATGTPALAKSLRHRRELTSKNFEAYGEVFYTCQMNAAGQVPLPHTQVTCDGEADCEWSEGSCSVSSAKMADLGVDADDVDVMVGIFAKATTCGMASTKELCSMAGDCQWKMGEDDNGDYTTFECSLSEQVYMNVMMSDMDPTAREMYQAHQVCSARVGACTGDCAWDDEEDECSVSPQAMLSMIPDGFCTDETAQACLTNCGMCADDEFNCPDSCDKCAHYAVCLLTSGPGVCKCQESAAKCEVIDDDRWPADTAWAVETMRENACAKSTGLCYCTSQSDAACKKEFDGAFGTVDPTEACAAAGSPVHVTLQTKRDALAQFVAKKDVACADATSAACTKAKADVTTATAEVEAAQQAADDLQSDEDPDTSGEDPDTDSAAGATASLVAVTAAALAAIL